MTMPTALELLVIAINLACAGLNLWQIRRWQTRIRRTRALEARCEALILEHLAARYAPRRGPTRDRATPLHH